MTKHRELAPGGGKGSVDRTTDVRRFHAEFDRIFGAKPVNKDKKAK